MLFILSGDIQTGKTRWLEALVDELASADIPTDGVIAPGVWRKRTDEEMRLIAETLEADCKNAEGVEGARNCRTGALDLSTKEGMGSTGPYEKLGIDNELLPEKEIVHFARRRDLAVRSNDYQEKSQSAQAKLGWAISDGAIERVNGHFERIASRVYASPSPEGSADACALSQPRFLVVDELGRLELLLDAGLTSAVSLLKRGASHAHPHALAVVRTQLLDVACEQFEESWDRLCIISPGEGARRQIMDAFGVRSLTRMGGNSRCF